MSPKTQWVVLKSRDDNSLLPNHYCSLRSVSAALLGATRGPSLACQHIRVSSRRVRSSSAVIAPRGTISVTGHLAQTSRRLTLPIPFRMDHFDVSANSLNSVFS